jgi:hypothetical protein
MSNNTRLPASASALEIANACLASGGCILVSKGGDIYAADNLAGPREVEIETCFGFVYTLEDALSGAESALHTAEQIYRAQLESEDEDVDDEDEVEVLDAEVRVSSVQPLSEGRGGVKTEVYSETYLIVNAGNGEVRRLWEGGREVREDLNDETEEEVAAIIRSEALERARALAADGLLYNELF